MNRLERASLLAEKSALEEMLAEIPLEDVLDRGGLQARLESIDGMLAAIVPNTRDPARVKLTFSGKPVVGSYGVLADFGAKAVAGFSEAVAAVAASLTAPLRAMGPIPNREQNQLLITNTAIGSFGFELEEVLSNQLPLNQLNAAEPTVMDQALSKTSALLLATVQADDDMLAESAAGLDKRAVDKIRTFVSTLADSDALCALQNGDSEFRFHSLLQVRHSLERLSESNLHETDAQLRGHFEGALPNKRRTFEFMVHETGEVIVGRFGPGVRSPEVVNTHLKQPCFIRVSITTAGQGKPKYVLLVDPDFDLQLPSTAP